MTGRNPDGAEDFPSEAACGPQRLDTIIGACEDFRDRVRGTDDLRFHFVLELPATETVPPAAPLLGGQQLPAGCPGSLRGGPVTGKVGRRPCDPVGQVAAETRIASRARQPQTGVGVPAGAPARQGPPWRAGRMGRTGWQPAGISGSGRRQSPSL
jgi:hypothetical protein